MPSRLDASLLVGQSVFTALTNDAPLMALVTGIYAPLAPETAVPVYGIVRVERSDANDSKTRLGQRHRLRVTLRGSQPSLTTVQQAAAAVMRVLAGNVFTLTGHRWIDCRYTGTSTEVNARTRQTEVNVRFQILTEQL